MFQCVHKQAFGIRSAILWELLIEFSGRIGRKSKRDAVFETRSQRDWSQTLTSVLLPAEYLLLVCITQTQNLVSCLASVWLKWHKRDGFTATDQRKLVSVSKTPDSVKNTTNLHLRASCWLTASLALMRRSVSWSLKSTFHSARWFLLCLRIKRNT